MDSSSKMAAAFSQNAEYQPPRENPPPYESQSAYQPQQQYVQTQPIIIQPGMTPVITTMVVSPVGAKPTNMNCKSCSASIVTKVNFVPSIRTHLLALLLCVIGCWPCACVPYCIDTCNNVDHYCPNCNAYVGSYQN